VISDDHLTTEEFWRRAAASTQPPATSSPAPISFRQAFETLVAAGHDVICLTLPGRHSGTFNAAWLAAQEFGQRVRVIDTGSFSLGMGLQVLAAAKAAVAGRSAEFIESLVTNLRGRTSVIFVLDTLEWVRRGGRLDRLMPLIERIASSLHIKPIVEMADGEFRLVGLARTYRSALQRIEDEIRSRLPLEALAAAYTRGRDTATDLATRLAAQFGLNPAEVMQLEAGPAFAAHAGPNALGAALIRAA
jgi:DegV family protein with EDD domain